MRCLLLCHIPHKYHQASLDYIEAFKKYSKYEIDVFDCYRRNISFDLNAYDVVIVHYSIIIVSDSYLTPYNRFLLKIFQGLKLLIIQDEHRWIDQTHACMQFIDFNFLLTVVPQSQIEKVYPRKKFPKLKKINVLTGYVSDNLKAIKPIPHKSRKLDVIYRAHKVSACLGDLGFEKWDIAKKFNKYNKKYKLKSDVTYESKDRIYGQAWLDFLQTSKAALGTESGSSIMDFDDSLRKKMEKIESEQPSLGYGEIRKKYLGSLNGKINMNQVSPKIFEYAACKTLMILYEGKYSGFLKPMVDFVPLKKDWSNISDVIKILNDRNLCKKIVDNARINLIDSGKFSYANYIAKVDKLIKEEFGKLNFKKANRSKKFDQYVYSKILNVKSYLAKIIAFMLVNKLPFLKNVLKSLGIRMNVYDSFKFYKSKNLLKIDSKNILHVSTCQKKEVEGLCIGKYKVCSSCKWAFIGYDFR